jgi:hypothetical protein
LEPDPESGPTADEPPFPGPCSPSDRELLSGGSDGSRAGAFAGAAAGVEVRAVLVVLALPGGEVDTSHAKAALKAAEPPITSRRVQLTRDKAASR